MLIRRAVSAEHTVAATVGLHLAPGVVVAAAYAAATPLARLLGLPSVASLAATGLLVIPVVQLGLLRVHRRRCPDDPAIRLRARTPWPRFLGWTALEVVLAGLAFLDTAPLVRMLQTRIFPWWPDAWLVRLGTEPGYSDAALEVTAVLMLIGSVFTAPLIEELYFRGYLLPRMPALLGRWQVPVHVTLFAAYHLWTPWLTPARMLAVLPLAYIAHRTRDVRIGVLTHALLNAADLAVLIGYLSAR